MPERTVREEAIELLRRDEWSFDGLRAELELTVRELDAELRHVDRTVRARGARLLVRPPRCGDCGFVLRARRAGYRTPGRCPRCRGPRVRGPWLRVR